MRASYLLDTNTVSYMIKGKSPAARARLEDLNEAHTICISSVTEAELRYGLAKRAAAHALRAAVEGLLFKLRVLPWGREEAAAYGLLRSELESAGKSLATMDLLIAAHAVSIGAVLVTGDQAFQHMARLSRIENWATDI